MNNTVLIAGASGLVGSQLIKLLLNDDSISKVYSLVRKSSKQSHKKLEEILFDFQKDISYENLPHTQTTFCCLGTTIKKAGSEEAFKQVDFHYPLKLAKAVKQKGCDSFHVITALGSDSKSPIFYNKVKGELEDALKSINFVSLNIYQPSLLLGDRKEKRFGERLATIIMPPLEFLLQGKLKKYRSIKAEDVAKGMFNNAKKENQKIQTIPSDEIKELANSPVNS